MNVFGPTRGYVLEVFNGHFQLPNLGPIGMQMYVCVCVCVCVCVLHTSKIKLLHKSVAALQSPIVTDVKSLDLSSAGVLSNLEIGPVLCSVMPS